MAAANFTELTKIKLLQENKLTPYTINNAPAETFRFVHIPSLLQDSILKIDYTKKVPEGKYACISYVWDGLKADDTTPTSGALQIDGLGDKDAVPIWILRTVCAAAQQFAKGCEYLWMDKLSIRQEQPSDNTFQVKSMYQIYKNCVICIITPGGTARLPKIDERTTWIDRAWTLQEALAPSDSRVLFQWNDPSKGQSGKKVLQSNFPLSVDPVEGEDGQGAAAADLKWSLEASKKSTLSILNPDSDGNNAAKVPTTRMGIFRGDEEAGYPVDALLGAMNFVGVEQSSKDSRLNAIWRSLIMRSAKYAEDLIFSSMGVMDGVIDRKGIKDGVDFDDAQVTQLLIRFVQKLIENGSHADWLSIAPALGPANGETGLASLPLKKNLGHGFIEVKPPGKSYTIVQPDLAKLAGSDGIWWTLSTSPKAQVYDNGDISFKAKAIAVVEESEEESTKNPPPSEGDWDENTPPSNKLVHLNTNRVWTISDNAASTSTNAFAVYIGQKEYYTDGAAPIMASHYTSLIMFVQQSDQGKYKNLGYAWGDERLGGDWQERDFTVA